MITGGPGVRCSHPGSRGTKPPTAILANFRMVDIEQAAGAAHSTRLAVMRFASYTRARMVVLKKQFRWRTS